LLTFRLLNVSRYEQILSKIESKRDEINMVDEEMKDLTIEKNEANDQMRVLERSLVELLVEQQKKLLSISSDNGMDIL
jgi:predicted  nucleic acid-binding Zn-ribbon protein